MLHDGGNGEEYHAGYRYGYEAAKKDFYESYDKGTDLYFKKGIIEGLNLVKEQIKQIIQSSHGDCCAVYAYSESLKYLDKKIDFLITQYQEKK